MSFRNTLEQKKIRRLERALKKDRLPKFINIITWLKDRGHAKSTGEAVRLIESEKVIADSHPLGQKTVEIHGKSLQVLDVCVPAALASHIEVLKAS